MIVDTHILMSTILYKNLSKHMNFKLNKLAFIYGNIKPDIDNKEINCPHTLEESLYHVNKYSEELIRGNISNRKFSMSLGIICHYICDYFCLYHREGNDKRGILEHLLYEIILHIRLITLLLKGKLVYNNYEISESSIQEILMELQKKYNSEDKCLTRDINYALFAAAEISKLIAYSSQLYYEQSERNALKEYLLS